LESFTRLGKDDQAVQSPKDSQVCLSDEVEDAPEKEEDEQGGEVQALEEQMQTIKHEVAPDSNEDLKASKESHKVLNTMVDQLAFKGSYQGQTSTGKDLLAFVMRLQMLG
jgi:hypothetical protein